MVLRERVSEHAYVFRSGLYAQVNAGLVTTDEGCVLIDTLPFPQETAEIAEFVKNRLRSEVKYIILTHSHADHVYGAYLFPEAEVVGQHPVPAQRGLADVVAAQQQIGAWQLAHRGLAREQRAEVGARV